MAANGLRFHATPRISSRHTSRHHFSARPMGRPWNSVWEGGHKPCTPCISGPAGPTGEGSKWHSPHPARTSEGRDLGVSDIAPPTHCRPPLPLPSLPPPPPQRAAAAASTTTAVSGSSPTSEWDAATKEGKKTAYTTTEEPSAAPSCRRLLTPTVHNDATAAKPSATALARPVEGLKGIAAFSLLYPLKPPNNFGHTMLSLSGC